MYYTQKRKDSASLEAELARLSWKRYVCINEMGTQTSNRSNSRLLVILA